VLSAILSVLDQTQSLTSSVVHYNRSLAWFSRINVAASDCRCLENMMIFSSFSTKKSYFMHLSLNLYWPAPDLTQEFRNLALEIQKAHEELPNRLIEAQKLASSCKSASECSGQDYNMFHIAENQLTIELISEESFEVWKPIFDDSHKKKLADIPDRGATEVPHVQPLTKECLRKRLLCEDVKLLFSVAEEVGFHSKVFKVHGFADKALCPAGSDAGAHRPSKVNVRNFHSPIIVTGAWEDKGILNDSFGHSETAQLFSSMDGFVEGAREVFQIQFVHFGGILAGVQVIESKKVLVCKCAQWVMTPTGEIMRQTSKLLTTECEVASGIEWWIRTCSNQLGFWKRSYTNLLQSSLSLGRPLSSIEESGSGQPQRESNANRDNNDSTSLQENVPSTRHSSHSCATGLRLDDYIVSVKSKELNVANQTQRWLLSSTIGNRRT
jgi:hypothetical protein